MRLERPETLRRGRTDDNVLEQIVYTVSKGERSGLKCIP